MTTTWPTRSSDLQQQPEPAQESGAAPPRRRVAIIYPFFPHYRQPVMTELARNGRHEYIFVGDTQPLHPTIKPWIPPADVPFVRIRNRHLRGAWFWQSGLWRISLQRDIDTVLIHLNPYWLGLVLSALLARISGKHVLNWTHGWTKRDRGIKRIVRKLVYRIPHGFLLYGRMAKIVGIDEGFAPDSLHVIYNSLDVPAQQPLRITGTPEEIRQIRMEAGLDPEVPVVVCTSRLVPERRLELLMEAAGRLRSEGHEVQVLLMGEGPERPKLEQAAAEFGARVTFYGACYDEPTIARLVGCANVTVAPERLGLTAMHSLTYGTPAVTHDEWEDQMPETEAVIPGRTGSFYRRGDMSDLMAHIRRWTAAPLPDPQVRAACYEAIDRFWNPQFQREAIERAIDGEPADDLFWMKQPSGGAVAATTA